MSYFIHNLNADDTKREVKVLLLCPCLSCVLTPKRMKEFNTFFNGKLVWLSLTKTFFFIYIMSMTRVFVSLNTTNDYGTDNDHSMNTPECIIVFSLPHN